MAKRRGDEQQQLPTLAEAVARPFDTIGFPVSTDPSMQGLKDIDDTMLGRFAHEWVNNTASPQGALTSAIMTGALGAAPFTGGSAIPMGVLAAAIANLLGQPLARTLMDKPMQNPTKRPGKLGPQRRSDIELPAEAKK